MRRKLRRTMHRYRRARSKKRLTAYFLFAAAAAGVFVFFTSSRFRVNDVVVAGLTRTHEEDVRNTVYGWLGGKWHGIIPNNIIWFIRSGSLASAIRSRHSTIRDVVVQRDFPSKLKLAIEEYDPWGVLCHADTDSCYWIDRAGIAFDNAPDFTGVVVPKIMDERHNNITLGNVQLSKNFMELITFFSKRAEADNYLKSLKFTIDAEDDTLRVKTRAGWDILLLGDIPPERAYNNLQTALKKIGADAEKLEYIDLRFGNKIFYRFIR